MDRPLIERYLNDIGEIRATGSGVPELSFYPALANLLSEIGKTLSPKVRCVMNLTNRGSGLPDGGLFTADQLRKKSGDLAVQGNPILIQNPSRGVIEAKSPKEDLQRIAESEQVERYWRRYGMVLVTNLRGFRLIGKGPDGRPTELESFELAESEEGFLGLISHPRKAAAAQGDRMVEFLKRALLHNAPLCTPQDVASLLASYAHDARLRIEGSEMPALDNLRRALEDALGLHFEGAKGERFFRSTLIQTLFYGVFSAWVLWARQRDARPSKESGFANAVRESGAPYAIPSHFEWRSAHYLLRVPMLRALFVQIADPAHLGSLGLTEILNWTASALDRVDRGEFFKLFDEGNAVQYFYEPFLHSFDPELRKELGVWYTPEEIVQYQVERVDAVLRSELGIADGLADPNVVVLDPCCGTGAYLRSVLRRIAATMREKGEDALLANDLKKAAMERIFGFEILPAPFVIAHLQLGLELETLGAPLSDRGGNPERAGVYLTNALTGWEPPTGKPKQITFPGFDEERDAAGKVKQEKPILVILGNPPYNAFAGVSPDEEKGLVEPYKQGLISDWGIKKYNLDDLYIRFFRLAEMRIAERGGRGVVSFISNHSWIGDPSFVVLRRHLLDSFDQFWIENMHGNRKISEYAPDGRTSETVFAIPGFSTGIQQGVAISLWIKKSERHGAPQVLFRDNLNDAKAVERRKHLLDSLESSEFVAQYQAADPCKENRWSFRPSSVDAEYLRWPRVTALCAEPPSNGLMEKRGGALMSNNRDEIESRMRRYFDKRIPFEDLLREEHPLTRDAARYDPRKARKKLTSIEDFDAGRILHYTIRPFDSKWCYYTPTRPIWNEPRPALWSQQWEGNSFLISRLRSSKVPEGLPFYAVGGLFDDHLLAPDASAFPLRLKTILRSKHRGATAKEVALPGMDQRTTANLSTVAREYLHAIGSPEPDANQSSAEAIWYHVLAVGCSPAYLAENADGIRQDWPRIPLPEAKEVLSASAALGRRVAALLDPLTPVIGVTTGKIEEGFKMIAILQRLDGRAANPESGDLDLTVGWGHAGKEGVTMPGKGRLVERADGAYDVYLNDVACWRNVPKAVWEYVIGGYQVIKKWLSYREKGLLGRGLTPDEARYVIEMARRIAALISIQPLLDENFRRVSTKPWAWPGQDSASTKKDDGSDRLG